MKNERSGKKIDVSEKALSRDHFQICVDHFYSYFLFLVFSCMVTHSPNNMAKNEYYPELDSSGVNG